MEGKLAKHNVSLMSRSKNGMRPPMRTTASISTLSGLGWNSWTKETSMMRLKVSAIFTFLISESNWYQQAFGHIYVTPCHGCLQQCNSLRLLQCQQPLARSIGIQWQTDWSTTSCNEGIANSVGGVSQTVLLVGRRHWELASAACQLISWRKESTLASAAWLGPMVGTDWALCKFTSCSERSEGSSVTLWLCVGFSLREPGCC